jgi:hypothetical protein
MAASLRDSLLEIYKVINDEDCKNRAFDTQTIFIGEKDIFTKKYTYYLESGQSSKEYFLANIQNLDESFFQNSVETIELIKPINQEQKLIEQAYTYFKSKIKVLIDTIGFEATFLKIIKSIKELFVICIEIDDYSMAFEIFESVNGQGVDLSVSDLIKNQIFKNVPNIDLQKAEVKWLEIIDNLENTGLNLSPQEFLRYYWASIYDYVPDAKLYNAITSKLNKKPNQSSQDWIALLDSMHRDSEVLNTYLNFSQEDWKTLIKDKKESEKIFKALRTLKSIKGKTWIVLFMSLFRKIEDLKKHGIKVGSLFQKIQEFSFVYFSIMGLPGNWYWIHAHSSSRAIHKSETKPEYTAAFEKLFKEFSNKLKFISESEFKEQFKSIQYSTNNLPIIYYILIEIELSLHAKTSTGFDPSKINIEHFLPQEPKSWGLSKNQIKNKVNMIGNLALISSNLNGILGNKTCAEKIQLIKEKGNELHLLNELVENIENSTWNFGSISSSDTDSIAAAIDSRQDHMAQHAYGIWKVQLLKKLGY